MSTSRPASVSSTLVTVWAFKRSCFLINVSMSTSVPPSLCVGKQRRRIQRRRGAPQPPVKPHPFAAPRLPGQLHSWERSPFSKKVHTYDRAGESGAKIVLVDGVDTIDVSAVDTNFVGHFYYGENKSVLSDIFNLIQGQPVSKRFGLKQRT